MKYCAACGTALDDAALFCSSCGAQQAPMSPVAPVAEAPVEVAPVVEAPFEVAPVVEVAPAPEYVQPVAPAAPVAPVAPVAPAYTVAYPPYPAPVIPVKSKILAGIGMGLSILGFIFSLIVFFLGITIVDSGYEEMAISNIVYVVMWMPLSILGLSFCGPARKDGVGGMAVTGKVFGIIGIVLYGLGFLMSCGGF